MGDVISRTFVTKSNKMKAINLAKYIVVTAGLLLLASVFLNFNQRINNWETLNLILMVMCGAGWLFFLIYHYRTGNKKRVLEMLVVLVILTAFALLL